MFAGIDLRKTFAHEAEIHALEHAEGEQSVDADHQHQRQHGQWQRNGAGQFVQVHAFDGGLQLQAWIVFAVAFTCQACGTGAGVDPQQTKPKHDQAGDDAQAGSCKGVRAEEGDRNGVLDGGRAWQRRHGEGEGAQCNGGGDQALGDAGLAEQGFGDRVDGERDHEQRDAAIGEHGAGQYHGGNGMAGTEAAHQPLCDGVGGTGVGHQLAEQGAQQKQRKEVEDVPAERSHEGVGVDREHEADIPGQEHGQCSHERREYQYRNTAVGEEDQQDEGKNDGECAHRECLLGMQGALQKQARRAMPARCFPMREGACRLTRGRA